MSGKSVHGCETSGVLALYLYFSIFFYFSIYIFQIVGLGLLERGCISECGKMTHCRVAKLMPIWVCGCVLEGFIMHLAAHHSAANYWGYLEFSQGIT